MWNVKVQIFLNFLILVSLFQGISGIFGGIKEQRKIASRPHLQNDFVETPGETAITTAITVDVEKFDDYKLHKLIVENFEFYENVEKERCKNGTRETLRRKIRKADYVEPKWDTLECISCYSQAKKKDSKCYEGDQFSTVKCSYPAQCFTEIHPYCIKRGCAVPNQMNRTFVCKCPLCNDKPSNDLTYFTYKTISEWEYDNRRLRKPMSGMDLMCKICDTRGINRVSDKICRNGKESDFMVCGFNQACYTNIDDEINYVSRGCITMPVYNSMFLSCNTQLCNNGTYSRLMMKREDLDETHSLKSSKLISSVAWIHSKNIMVVVIVTFSLNIIAKRFDEYA